MSVEVRYLVGAADEPPGKTGLAHLVEHVMFARRAGPGGPAGSTISSQEVALTYNAATTWDSTHYITIGLASRLDDLLRDRGGAHGRWLRWDRRGGSGARARGRAGGLAQRDAADVREPLQNALFGPAHAYGHSIGGRDVATLTRDDVCRFIDAHYAPARAILVVSGSIPGPAVHDITARFGAISRRATGTRAVVRAVGVDRAGQRPAGGGR